jgi:hypothetical protein
MITGTVYCRLLRVQALSALGMLPQAVAVIEGLMEGRNLPDSQAGMGEQALVVGADKEEGQAPAKAGGAKGGAVAAASAAAAATASQQHAAAGYQADKWPTDAANLPILERIVGRSVTRTVQALYSPWLMGLMTMARAGVVLAAVGSYPCCWRLNHPLTAEEVTSPSAPSSLGSAEQSLLDKAALLLQGSVNVSRVAVGLPAVTFTAPGAGGAGGSRPPTGGAGLGGKGSGAAPPLSAKYGGEKDGAGLGASAGGAAGGVGEGGSPELPSLLTAQHSQLAAEGLLLLAQLEERRWAPHRSLQVSDLPIYRTISITCHYFTYFAICVPCRNVPGVGEYCVQMWFSNILLHDGCHKELLEMQIAPQLM